MTRPPIDVPVIDVDYYGREALLPATGSPRDLT